MSRSLYTEYESLFPRFMLQIQPCPRVVVLDAVQTVAGDFFTRSGIWREMLVASVFKGDRFADLPMERGTAFVRAVEVRLDGTPLEGGKQFTIQQAGEGATIGFTFEPDQDRTAYVLAVLRPSRTATAIPSGYADEWVDVLVFGTLARLKSMSGQHVGFSDPQGAALNLQLYEDGIARAKVLVARGRDGRKLFVGGRKS